MSEPTITRRGYLILRGMIETGATYPIATEAVASLAIEHPEGDLDEKRTWSEWMRHESRPERSNQ